MKNKGNIILLIVAIVVFCIALIFAIWAFQPIKNKKIEQPNAENITNDNQATSENANQVNNKNTTHMVNNTVLDSNANITETKNDINALVEDTGEEVSKTKDLSITYTDFTVFDKENQEIKLSDFQNTPVMVLFWNSDNAESVEMLKRVNQLYEMYNNKIQFLAVSTQDINIDAFIQQYSWEVTMPIYFDLNQEYANTLKIEELPAMLYINKENEVFNAKTGLTTNDALEANLDVLIENY